MNGKYSIPATGWMPNLTFLPFFLRSETISAIGYWALATQSPYPKIPRKHTYHFMKMI